MESLSWKLVVIVASTKEEKNLRILTWNVSMIHLLITASIPETVVSYLNKDNKTVLYKTDNPESVYQ